MKKLEEIIEEIRNLSNDLINTQTDEFGVYEDIKNKGFKGDRRQTTKEFWDRQAEIQKENAINFITSKYNEINQGIIDKNSAYSEYDYEIAYYKTFQQYFNIILDQNKLEEIDTYLNKEVDIFAKRLNQIYEN